MRAVENGGEGQAARAAAGYEQVTSRNGYWISSNGYEHNEAINDATIVGTLTGVGTRRSTPSSE